MATVVISESGSNTVGSITVQYDFKKEDIMHAALTSVHENSEYKFISYNKMAGIIRYGYRKRLDEFRVYVIGIENTLESTYVTVRVVSSTRETNCYKFYDHIDYMVDGITRNLKGLLVQRE